MSGTSVKFRILFTGFPVIFNQKFRSSMINKFCKAGIPILFSNWKFLTIYKIAYKMLKSFNFIERNIKLTFSFLFYSLLKKRVGYALSQTI